MPAPRDVLLADRELLTGGDHDLFAHDVHAGDHFGHRVFDLHARVHFNKVELAVLIQKLEGAGAAVADLAAGLGATLADLVAQPLRQAAARAASSTTFW